jgi:hypothetical protein
MLPNKQSAAMYGGSLAGLSRPANAADRTPRGDWHRALEYS